MANENTVLMITNKSADLSGIINPIDENNISILWEDETEEYFSSVELDSLLESEDFELEEVEVDEDFSPAQATVVAHKTADVAPGTETDGNPKTKLDWIRAIIGQMADMDMNTLTKIFNDQQALIGGEGDRAGLGNAVSKNQGSIQMHPSAAMESVVPKLQKDEQDAIFSESTLTEEAKAKVSTLFETAVLTRVSEEVVKLQETYEKKLEENIIQVTENLIENINSYIEYIATEWLKENEVAIESSLRSELTSDFLEGLKNLFKENYIDIPEDKVDVIETLVKENEDLKAKLNSKLNEDIEAVKSLKLVKKENSLLKLSEGLTLAQKERLKKLTEGTEFETEAKFEEKVKIIKEGFLNEKNTNSNLLNEGLETPTNVVKPNSSIEAMANILSKVKN